MFSEKIPAAESGSDIVNFLTSIKRQFIEMELLCFEGGSDRDKKSREPGYSPKTITLPSRASVESAFLTVSCHLDSCS